MNIALDCIPCIINNYIKLIQNGSFSEEIKEENLRRFLAFISKADYKQSPPVLGREIHRMIRKMLKNNDPYSDIKQKYNRMILKMYSEFENMIKKSCDPFDTALKLAIAGNVIDFGCQHQLGIMNTVQKVLNADIKNKIVTKLKNDLRRAGQILYIGDNCGEIVFDKLFIQTINHPDIYFAVRGGAVINDVTKADAEIVGMDEYARIITTGDDSPGAVWETCSGEFQTLFKQSDVVIAKGQGNLEGLIDVKHNIYFLFVVKCNLIASRVGANIGEFIIKNSSVIHNNTKGK
jgi:uncharacterized protein with ATP-grasp and redox domains